MTYKTNWNLSLIGNTSLEEVEKVTQAFAEKWQERHDYLEDPTLLKEALDEFNQWQKKYAGGGDEAYRVALESALDQNDSEIRARYNKIYDKSLEFYNQIQFFPLRIAKIPPQNQKKFLEDPNLQKYRHFLEGQFEIAKYLLTEKEERIMNLKSKVSYGNWVDMTESLISKETRGGKSFSEIISLLSETDKETRDQAAKWFNDILENNIDPGEHEINSVLEDAKINHSLRGYERPDKPRHISDDIDTEVVDALLEAVTQGYDIAQNFYELKSKLFGVKKLEYHERNVPYARAEKEYEFEDAVDLIDQTFKDLDPEFSSIFQTFLKRGQFDVYPKKDKVSGAGCWSNLKSQPAFIHLNFSKKLRDVTTIAHEMGHAIHHKLIASTQPALYVDTSMAVAETASTFMEDFVIQAILEDADEDLRLALQMEQLNDSVSSIQRQIACYRFEQALHNLFRETGYLSKEDIGELFQEHMKSYMGEYVEQSPGSQNWWLYWDHIRRHFYVYSYASGLLISKSLQNKVKENPEFIIEVKRILEMGTSRSPKDAFAEVDIDITDPAFWELGLKEQKDLLEDTWTLAEKLGKI